MKSKFFWSGVILLAVLSGGCKSPFSRTSDSSSGPAGSVGASGQFPIFSDELKSGGGAFEYPGGDNVSLSFTDQSNPISKRSIRFSWNGQPADGIALQPTLPSSIFAGVSLMHVPVFANYDSTPGRDLRAAGYTQAAFYVRGTLSTNTSLKIEAGGPSSACITLSASGTIDKCGNLNVGTLTSGWTFVTLHLIPAEQSAVKDFLKATFIFDNPTAGNTSPGQGGTVYLDQIFYKV